MNKSFLISIILICSVSILYKLYAPHNTFKGSEADIPYFLFEKMFSDEEIAYFRELSHNVTFRHQQYSDQTIEVNYGSSDPDANGKCPSIYQTLNENRTKCLINSRIDVGLHYFLTGGIMNRQENVEKLSKRAKYYLSTFHYLKNNSNFEGKHRIFSDPLYKQKMYIACQNRTVTEYFTTSYVINIPGQEIPIHYDTPYFIQADRNTVPPWLDTIMIKSGLFDDIYIPAIQGVTYLHDWNTYNYSLNKGGLKFWPKGTAHEEVTVPPVPNTGLIFDGSIMAHGTETFRPYMQPPSFTKDSFSNLKFLDGKWKVIDEKGKVMAEYDEKDVRITLVWRNGCFHDEAQRQKFKEGLKNPLKIKDIIDRMLNDLTKRGIITERPKTEHETVDLLVRSYMDYPYDRNTWFPYNACIIAELIHPAIAKLFCN